MAKKIDRKPALKVVFDTNALWTEPAHHLLSKDVKEVIAANSSHTDVAISWHLPEVVLHERTYQMQEKALALLAPINRVEKLLGHNLAITGDTLKAQVRKVIDDQRVLHNLAPIALDNARVDWAELSRRAAFREAPFEQQKEGKGFRDALIVEALVQLVEDSPATEAICRVAFVSQDVVIARAAEERLKGRNNVRVLNSLEELKGLINTIVSEIPEDLVEQLAEAAWTLFFVRGNKDTLYYKENLRQRVQTEFGAAIFDPPPGATKVAIEAIRIDRPNFVRKKARVIEWTSRIHYDLKATNEVPKAPEASAVTLYESSIARLFAEFPKAMPPGAGAKTTGAPPGSPGLFKSAPPTSLLSVPTPTETVTVGTSQITFEVPWSTTLGHNNKLRAPKIADIKIAVAAWNDGANGSTA